MKHPLTGKPIFLYLMAWGVVYFTHGLILCFYYNLSWPIAAVDSFVFNSFLAGLGLSYWYVVRFVSPSNQGTVTALISHTVALTLSVLLTNFISLSLLSQLFPREQVYAAFLTSTLPWRFISGALYMLIIIMVYYLLHSNFYLRKKEEDELQMQNLLKQSELEMLKFQINPHFIFNSLNSISSLTITNPDLAREMVIKLSDFLRSSLGKDNPESHTLKDELDQMNLYIDIEKIRFGEKLLAKNEVDPACLKMTLPSRILQPLYENAIKYGVYEQLDQVEVKTRCSCEDGNLKISISNNYDSESVPQKGKGIGLRNVRNRIELIYGIPGLVTIHKEKTLFMVQLLIPQMNKND